MELTTEDKLNDVQKYFIHGILNIIENHKKIYKDKKFPNNSIHLNLPKAFGNSHLSVEFFKYFKTEEKILISPNSRWNSHTKEKIKDKKLLKKCFSFNEVSLLRGINDKKYIIVDGYSYLEKKEQQDIFYACQDAEFYIFFG